MGQLIAVTEKRSPRQDVVRFETDRAITGMAHERYLPGDVITGTRPPDRLARLLLEFTGVDSVHIHGNIITVDLGPGATTQGMAEAIEDLFIHYKPGVQPSIIG